MFLNNYKKDVAYITEDFSELAAGEGSFLVERKSEKINGEITKHTLTYKNTGGACKIIPVFQQVSEGEPSFYMIPCVNYNGNTWGTCQEPKGSERDGEPWIFPSDRIGVPACSVAEFEKNSVGIFAENDESSTDSSASIFFREGKTVQRIYFSHIEYPVVYAVKFVYTEPIISFIPFESGESRVFVCYSYNRAKQGEKFGYGGIWDYVNTNCVKPMTPRVSAKDATEYNFEFIQNLVVKEEYGYVSNMGLLPNGEHRLGDANSQFSFRKVGAHEIGWCGQNVTIAEMHIRKYLETKDAHYLEVGTGILDTWLTRQHESGVVSVHLDRKFEDGEHIDGCNEGWLLQKLVICCELLKKAGVDASKYEQACHRIAGYYLKLFPHGGFPQVSNGVGEVVNPNGCAGAFLVLGFLFAYKYFGNSEYFERGREAFDFYYGTYLANSIAAGGALDTYCIDKESAGPVLRAALMMYDLTNDRTYIEKAKQVAYYLMTWTYHHDVPFPQESDCAKMGVRTTGGTSVSTAHQHLDVWGVYYVPDMARLASLTGNDAFLEQAKILWMFTLQYISDGTLTLHGMTRPKGAQNEAVLHCNWNWSADGKKGQLNDWLVSWVTTFRLDVYYALKDTSFFENL